MNISSRNSSLFTQTQRTSPKLHAAANSSPPPVPLQRQQTQPLLSRQTSEISLYDQNSSQFMNNDDILQPWTRKQWEALELWYDKLDRDYQRAATAFYIHESVVCETDPPLWSKEHVLWRSQCLDTNTKYHHGILPSERKRRRDLMKNKKKQDILKRQRSIQQERQLEKQQEGLEQGSDRKIGYSTIKTTDILDDLSGSNIGINSNNNNNSSSRSSSRIRNSNGYALE
ncbi:hypothetical protein BC941DRAFT_472522 [Chlamydoabsidia padenii]|nr:hypothetical protein BC941DRAFT_472522 [Chlamydoabsidia padenii]